jgi:hypothetical protein
MLFDITLRRDLARNFGATVVVILTVVLTIMLIRTLGQAAVGRIAPQDVALLLGYVALGYLPLILSLSLFIAVVATLGRMYRDSEMAIWFSSGIGLSRFVRPVLGVSAPVLVVVGLLALLVWPWENERGVELKDRFERRSTCHGSRRDSSRRRATASASSSSSAIRTTARPDATSSSSRPRRTPSRSHRRAAAGSRSRMTAAIWSSTAASATRKT